jgi:DNA-binding response OmpR family regulator
MAKVLVVEDEPQLLQNISSILDLFGFTVIQATNGKHGLAAAIEHQPDIIVCDVMMDEMNGFELLEQLKLTTATETIPFVFLSARADIIDKEKGILQGANAYLTKPFNSKELVSTINSLLAK